MHAMIRYVNMHAMIRSTETYLEGRYAFIPFVKQSFQWGFPLRLPRHRGARRLGSRGTSSLALSSCSALRARTALILSAALGRLWGAPDSDIRMRKHKTDSGAQHTHLTVAGWAWDKRVGRVFSASGPRAASTGGGGSDLPEATLVLAAELELEPRGGFPGGAAAGAAGGWAGSLRAGAG